VIVAVAAASVIALTLLTRPLVGAIWGLVLVCAAAWHGYRWLERRGRQSQ
jgi:membrane protein implicated in regulation of membrane protease activity